MIKGEGTFEATPFTTSGRWIRANFHCHTTNSDGGLSVEETVAVYRKKGYHCLGISDHRQVTPVAHLSDADFVAINSTENGGRPDVLGVDVRAAVDLDLPFGEKVKALADQGGFTIGAHPTFSASTPEEYRACPDIDALEICNAYCDEAYANGLATELWDMLLGEGRRIWGVASDDAHLNPAKRYYSDAGKGWIQVWVPELGKAQVMDALRRGAFYASQGPSFRKIEIEDRVIRVETSPVRQVRWRTHGHVGFVDHAPEGELITRSEIPDWYRPNVFVRVELVDAEGRKAWSNPVFLRQE